MVGGFQVSFLTWFLLFAVVYLVGVVALVVGALWMYRDAQSRGMDAIVWVVILVIATLVATVIGFAVVFVLYLIVRESYPAGGTVPFGYTPYPTAVIPAPCPVCGRAMAWYPQYQRWYCPACGQYR